MEEDINYMIPIIVSLGAVVWPILLWKYYIKKDISYSIGDVIFIFVSIPCGALFDYLYICQSLPIIYVVILIVGILLMIASRITVIKHILDTEYILKVGDAS